MPIYTDFAKQIGVARAILYSYLSGNNTHEIKAKDFLEASSRFGLDSPVPIITRRLSFYGNT